MGRIITCFFFIQSLLLKIPSVDAQTSLQQYLQLAGIPYSAIQVPATSYSTPTPIPNYPPNIHTPQHQVPPNSCPVPPHSHPGLVFSAASSPNFISESPHPVKENPTLIQSPATSNIDAKLLNNLAVALQLLIVSNILNSPPPETVTEKVIEFKSEPVKNVYNSPEIAYNPPQMQYYMSQDTDTVLPVANYGTPTYAEQSSAYSSAPRRGLSMIQSPYEALRSPLPFSEPQFSSLSPRKALQSPYTMIDNQPSYDMNLFSMNDLF